MCDTGDLDILTTILICHLDCGDNSTEEYKDYCCEPSILGKVCSIKFCNKVYLLVRNCPKCSSMRKYLLMSNNTPKSILIQKSQTSTKKCWLWRWYIYNFSLAFIALKMRKVFRRELKWICIQFSSNTFTEDNDRADILWITNSFSDIKVASLTGNAFLFFFKKATGCLPY